MKTLKEIDELAIDVLYKEYNANRPNKGIPNKNDIMVVAVPTTEVNLWVKGYTHCQQENADKKYTLEDIKQVIELARENTIGYYAPNSPMVYYDKTYQEIIDLMINKYENRN